MPVAVAVTVAGPPLTHFKALVSVCVPVPASVPASVPVSVPGPEGAMVRGSVDAAAAMPATDAVDASAEEPALATAKAEDALLPASDRQTPSQALGQPMSVEGGAGGWGTARG